MMFLRKILNDLKDNASQIGNTLRFLPGVFVIIIILGIPVSGSAQSIKNNDDPDHFSGAVTLTNNGISFIPTFSLDKPAAVFDLSMGKRLSFDPQFRFALEGKPWSFIFWWRYKLVSNEKFRFSIGAHPAVAFRNLNVLTDDGPKDITFIQRYVAGELSPNYLISKNVSVGIYYLYARCLDKDSPANTHFLTLNANFSDIRLSKQYYLKLVPQVFYLKLDQTSGYYFTSSLTLARKNFPLTVSTIINKEIKSSVAGSRDFVWNINLIYSFSGNYSKAE